MTGSMVSSGRPRRAACAGTFYPADPTSLTQTVDEQLEAARHGRSLSAGSPLGLLAPHAGIEWSGSIAARAWVELEQHPMKAEPGPTVVLLGTNHFAPRARGVSVWPGGPWLTPLGDLPIDDDLREQVIHLGPPFVARAQPHLDEHSIEVELPFVARVRPDARLLPLLVGPLEKGDRLAGAAALGHLLGGLRASGSPILLAVSSDLAHYPTQAVANEVDAVSLRAIAALDADGLARHEMAAEATGVRGLACALCGIEPTAFGIAALAVMGSTIGRVLAHGTSADAPGGSAARVVGYAAVRFD